VDGDFGDDVRVQPVAEINGVNVVAVGPAMLAKSELLLCEKGISVRGAGNDAARAWRGPSPTHHSNTRKKVLYHSRSLYMMVKKTWRKRLTAFISTAKRYNHASPDILAV
jgi:hypothetical protein